MNINNRAKKSLDQKSKLFENQTSYSDFENQEIPPKLDTEINEIEIETALTVKSKQFNFECGVSMGNFKIDTGNNFSLKYHADNTVNFDSFLSSVINMLPNEDAITPNDINKLESEYNKYKN